MKSLYYFWQVWTRSSSNVVHTHVQLHVIIIIQSSSSWRHITRMTSTTVDIKSVLELVCISAAYDTCFRAAILHTPSRYWQPAGYSVRISNKKINIFAPVGKTMRWIEKWLPPFWMVSSTPSYITMQSWGDQIKLRAPAVGAKIWCLSLSRFGLPARGLNKCCVMVCGSILMLFSSFFSGRDCPLRCAREFLLSSLGGATIFAKLRSKIVKSLKICGKVCAPHLAETFE